MPFPEFFAVPKIYIETFRVDCSFRSRLKDKEVASFGDAKKDQEFIPLKKSVKAQVHSLEARGRQLISVRQQSTDGTGKPARSGFHKQMPPRSRSENPLNRQTRGGFTYLPQAQGGSHNHIVTFLLLIRRILTYI